MEESCENRIPNYFIKSKVLKDRYYFKWLIENFSLITSERLESEQFKPVSNAYFKVWFEKRSLEDYMVCLRGYVAYKTTIVCKMIISDGQGKKLFGESYKNTIGYDWSDLEMPIKSNDFKEISFVSTDKIEINLFLYFTKSTDKFLEYSVEEFHLDMKNSLSEDLIKAFDDQIGTDMTLNVQKESVHVHRAILCARSPVFAKMFQQEMAETQKKAVDIQDIGMPALKEMLNYMYSKGRWCDYDFETALQVYYAADKYQVIHLRDICGEILSHNLSPSKSAEVLLLAHQHDDNRLKAKVKEYFNKNLKSCLKENCWFELRDKNLELFKEIMECTGAV